MPFVKTCAILVLVSVASASKPAFWKGTSFASSVEEMRSMCAEDDPIACLKFKAISFLDTILQKDNYQLSDSVEVSRNSYSSNEVTSRGESSLEDNVEDYIKRHDVTFQLPVLGTVTLGARNLDTDEIDLKLNYGGAVEEGRKSKLKKIIIPILVFVLLKAMTLVPLALGVLGLKAWNALQLSFFSFVVAVGLAVFQLCKKIAAEHAPPHIAAHAPWEPAYAPHFAARSFDEPHPQAQAMAYSAYAPQ